ncbi:hypothetical protein FHS25_001534 [Rhizobium laguerreae]|uniref:Uncharacterized protein n=1 Tax=Rhizobium laguerreae TaxID=1076926 RepID=A0ABR6G492_9HYPH|nr:hypothetical protein [Rhizobium laguerreae]
MTHGADSLCETNISQHLISSKVSQSQNCTPEHTFTKATRLMVLLVIDRSCACIDISFIASDSWGS